jgi:putative endonuclease
MTVQKENTKTSNPWFVYILHCADNTLYVGITTDVTRRVHEHNAAKLGAKYTRMRRPVALVYQEQVNDRSAAATREYELKQLSRAEKIKLIRQSQSDQ